MLQLQSMRTIYGEEIRTVDRTAYDWNAVAVALGFQTHDIYLWEKNNPRDGKKNCYDMFSTWIDRCQDVTWEALVDALCRAGFESLGNEIKSTKLR